MNRRLILGLICLALVPVVFVVLPASAYTLSAILIFFACYFLARGVLRRKPKA